MASTEVILISGSIAFLINSCSMGSSGSIAPPAVNDRLRGVFVYMPHGKDEDGLPLHREQDAMFAAEELSDLDAERFALRLSYRAAPRKDFQPRGDWLSVGFSWSCTPGGKRVHG